MGSQSGIVVELHPVRTTACEVEHELDELLCSPALAAARDALWRIQSCRVQATPETAETLLLEEDGLRHVVSQIVNSEIPDWREAEYLSNAAATRLRNEFTGRTHFGPGSRREASANILQRDAVRCDATQEMLASLATQADLLIATAGHWRTLACNNSKSPFHVGQLEASRDALEAAASLIACGYLGAQLPKSCKVVENDRAPRELVLPMARLK